MHIYQTAKTEYYIYIIVSYIIQETGIYTFMENARVPCHLHVLRLSLASQLCAASEAHPRRKGHRRIKYWQSDFDSYEVSFARTPPDEGFHI
jgi:hypothetical protein